MVKKSNVEKENMSREQMTKFKNNSITRLEFIELCHSNIYSFNIK